MIIYLDYYFIINILFDFILLFGIAITLKRKIKVLRMIFSILFGGISAFIVFLNVSSFLFFILKMFTGIVMLIIAFNYKGIRYTLENIIYLMVFSVIVGGSLYLINLSFGYEHVGMIFFTNGKKLNIFILIFIAFVMIILYKKIFIGFRANYKNVYSVRLYQNGKMYLLTGYLDTGNSLNDPYFNKPIFILNSNIKIDKNKYILVPYNTIKGDGMMKCVSVDRISIDGIGDIDNALVGITENSFDILKADIILHRSILEGICKE